MQGQTKSNSTSLELLPGTALGPFQLGSLLFNVLNHLREYRDSYPQAQLAWDEENPLTGPVHLTLTKPPLHFTFVGPSQRLACIQVTGSRPGTHVAYRSQRIQEPGQGTGTDEEEVEEEEDEDDIVKRIRRILGPTYGSSQAPGEASTRNESEAMLCYPGIAFGISGRPSGSQRLRRIVLTPLPAPESVPVDQAWLHPELDESRLAIAHGDLARATVQLPSGETSKPIVTLAFHSLSDPPSSRTSRRGDEFRPVEPVTLEIGETTSEDVLCDLGSAIRTFWKEDDRLSIHTAAIGAHRDASLEPKPYFLSYPHLGLTLMMSVPSSSQRPHLLEKVILHSNLPGQVQFGRTTRARWTLRCGKFEETGQVKPSTKVVEAQVEDGWQKVREALRRSGAREDDKPMILDRTAYSSDTGATAGSSGGSLSQDAGIKGQTTEIYGFSSGVACEVTQSGDIETLWLF